MNLAVNVIAVIACVVLILPAYAEETQVVEQAPKADQEKTTDVETTINTPTEVQKPETPTPVIPLNVAAPAKPVAPAMPAGYDAAVKAFKAKKYPEAAKAFQGFIKSGFNDERIHDYLAQCYYHQRAYSKAITEYEWIAKNGKNSVSMQHSAAKMARTLKCYMMGVCPENCVKANDPRWQSAPGLPGLWIKFDTPDGPHYLSRVHVGQLLTFHRGHPHAGERCPVCRGAGKVRVLKDGDPL